MVNLYVVSTPTFRTTTVPNFLFYLPINRRSVVFTSFHYETFSLHPKCRTGTRAAAGAEAETPVAL